MGCDHILTRDAGYVPRRFLFRPPVAGGGPHQWRFERRRFVEAWEESDSENGTELQMDLRDDSPSGYQSDEPYESGSDSDSSRSWADEWWGRWRNGSEPVNGPAGNVTTVMTQEEWARRVSALDAMAREPVQEEFPWEEMTVVEGGRRNGSENVMSHEEWARRQSELDAMAHERHQRCFHWNEPEGEGIPGEEGGIPWEDAAMIRRLPSTPRWQEFLDGPADAVPSTLRKK